ncbi:MAG: GNAT family N-acetyltransferase, partial [Ktedonobacterales bacterium]
APPLPDGIELRAATPAHYRAIWKAVQEAYADSPQNVVSDEDDYQQWLRAPGFDPALWQVAWAGREVAGQVLGEVAYGHGEVAEVSVRKPWRRSGLGRALLTRDIALLRARDAAPIRLHCRADNRFGAPRLYESVGFRPLKTFARCRKPLMAR